MIETSRNVQLRVFRENTQKEIFRVEAPREIIIGTGDRADIHVDDMNVSFMHCFIRVDENQQCFITDLNSTNGTRLNGHRIDGSRRLFSGDLIQLGYVTIS
jgi:pSer/pThr/pTyr-binding forkhead associated (FHA) protein